MIKNNEFEKHKIDKRTNILFLFVLLLFLIIISRMFYLQVVEKSNLSDRAQSNIIKTEYVSPIRGIIKDRDGNIIAGNKSYFDVYVIPEKISHYRGNLENRQRVAKDLILEINELLDENYQLNENMLSRKIAVSPSFSKVYLYSLLNGDEVGYIQNELRNVKGVAVKPKIVRNYPYDDLFFHSLGYVGRIDKKDLVSYNDISVIPDDYIGKTGIEKSLNRELYGKVGVEKIKINASGREKDRWLEVDYKKGKDISVSLSLKLHQKASDLMLGKRGAIVVLEVNTGKIITYYSSPSFNPNKIIEGLSRSEYNQLFKSSDSALFDRAGNADYSPASTIKPFVATAALLGEFIEADEVINSLPSYRVGNKNFRDWVRWGHGELSLSRSLSRSSNYYYYRLGHQMGVDYMHDVLSLYGFGKQPKLDIDFRLSSGLLPSNAWKKENFNDRFYAGEEVIIAIGQGQILVSPLQMAYATKIIANDGYAYELSFFKDSEINLLEELLIPKQYLSDVRQGLYDTVNTKDGTARVIRTITDVVSAGKTGTAQAISTHGELEIDYDNEDESVRPHSWFMGYAPYDNPEIAIVVIGENQGGGSGFASEAAGYMIEEYFQNYSNYYKEDLIESNDEKN